MGELSVPACKPVKIIIATFTRRRGLSWDIYAPMLCGGPVCTFWMFHDVALLLLSAPRAM